MVVETVLLFANGILKPGPAVQRALESCQSPIVVCADGGALHARSLGLTPAVIIGDFDSLSPADVAAFEAAHVQIIRHPPEKDETDLELALHFCRELGATRLWILGGLGGRFDQSMANILLLTLPELQNMRIAFVDGAQTIRLLAPGEHKIAGASGDTLSLIPLLGAAEGITTRNLKYALAGETLEMGPARGISNVMLADCAEVALGAGQLLLVHTCGRAQRYTIIKRDVDGKEELRYSGLLHLRTTEFVCIDAAFALGHRDLGYIQLRQGDQFREWFYIGRWYNIFRVSEAGSGALKGWYCNITRPPDIMDSHIAADDLCLDLFVDPDGRTLLLDEPEFARLDLTPRERELAWQAVADLRQMVAQRRPPFDEIEAPTPDRDG